MTLASKWSSDLVAWGIPSEILDQAPESPWIHPPALFSVPANIPDTPSHQRAREVLSENSSVLDIGCGGGIAAFAVAPPAGKVIGIDHQSEMLTMFASSAEERGLLHQEILGDWPDVQNQAPDADVVTCHHVVFNVSRIEDFLIALDAHATKRVIIEMPQQHPLSTMTQAWKHFWNLDRPQGPTSSDLVAIAESLGFNPKFENWSHPVRSNISEAENIEFTRIRLCLPADRDLEVAEFLATHPAAPERKLTTIWWDK